MREKALRRGALRPGVRRRRSGLAAWTGRREEEKRHPGLGAGKGRRSHETSPPQPTPSSSPRRRDLSPRGRRSPSRVSSAARPPASRSRPAPAPLWVGCVGTTLSVGRAVCERLPSSEPGEACPGPPSRSAGTAKSHPRGRVSDDTSLVARAEKTFRPRGRRGARHLPLRTSSVARSPAPTSRPARSEVSQPKDLFLYPSAA